MKWIGLTGGIATGKTTVEKLVQSLGVPVIDADQLAHNAVQPGKAGLKSIESYFGSHYITSEGNLDRKKMGQLVFNDNQARLELERLLHPLIQTDVKKLRNKYENQNYQSCVYSVPLLFEKKLEDQFDLIITVWCDPHVQLERLMARNNLSTEEAQLRINAQLPFWMKIKKSNFCIDNSTNLRDLEVQVKSLVEKHF